MFQLPCNCSCLNLKSFYTQGCTDTLSIPRDDITACHPVHVHLLPSEGDHRLENNSDIVISVQVES